MIVHEQFMRASWEKRALEVEQRRRAARLVQAKRLKRRSMRAECRAREAEQQAQLAQQAIW